VCVCVYLLFECAYAIKKNVVSGGEKERTRDRDRERTEERERKER